MCFQFIKVVLLGLILPLLTLGDVNARNGIAITTASTINGITPVSAVNGQTVVSASFDPADYGTPQIWLAARKETGFSDGDTVTTPTEWINSWTFTQGTGANQPTYQTNVVNGLPSFQFDGINDGWAASGTDVFDVFRNIGSATVMAIVMPKAYTPPTGGRILFASRGTDNVGSRLTLMIGNVNTTNQFRGLVRTTDAGSLSDLNANSVYTPGNAYLETMQVQQASGSQELFRDGISEGSASFSGANTSNTASQSIMVGNDPSNSNPFADYLLELIVWVPALSQVNREAAETELGAIYGITITH